MDFASWSTWQRWRYALKPGSWPKLLVPCVLGQGLGVVAAPRVSWVALALGVLFTLCDLAFIVFLNDWGDQGVDRIKREMFPHGCSPKTIPDGILSSRALLWAGLGCGALGLLSAIAGEWWLARLGAPRPGLSWTALGCLLVFVAYSLPPLRLNYRGGGEALEMLGVGVALPYFNFYLQAGRWWSPWVWPLLGFALLSLGSALASGLSDEESDRAGGKRTLASVAGNEVTRQATELLVLLGAVAWVCADGALVGLWFVGGLGALIAVGYWLLLRRGSASAVTNAFTEQGLYKQHLHHAIW
ncbi:MAG: prenyltransferase, partial [Myxococcales bacterium]|nr:prenyltransferase [Myxococcales bacterium]